MAGCLTGVMDPFRFSELPEESMPQHVGGDIYFFCLREMRIGLGGNTLDDAIRFTARELSAVCGPRCGASPLPC
jgi:hypothetical protein